MPEPIPHKIWTSAELLKLCEAAVVPEVRWRDGDSEAAHRQLGECWSLLKAGCTFRVDPDTNERTIWLRILGHEEYKFFLPTWKSLEAAGGGDWYNV